MNKSYLIAFLMWFVLYDPLGAQTLDMGAITITQEDITLGVLIKQLEETHPVNFAYSNQMDLSKIIHLKTKNYSIDELLQQITDQTPYVTDVQPNGKVLIYRKAADRPAFTISGYLRDEKSGEVLIGASIMDQISRKGTTSNLYGFYSLTLPQGAVQLHYSYVGYRTHSVTFDLKSDTTMALDIKPMLLQEVVVSAEKEYQINETTENGTIHVPIQQIKAMPILNGEADLIKTMQMLPGVQAGNEGSAGLYVRGGGPDQNLVLLDGVPIYNASHLFGFYSVFNTDAVNHVKLIKGGFPARYGGRLSSVLDVRMKDGNMSQWHGNVTLGLVMAKATLEVPIVKNKLSAMVSARYSYRDPLLNTGMNQDNDEVGDQFRFYDLYFKLNYKVGSKDRIYLNGFLSHDKAKTRTHDEVIRNEIVQYDEKSEDEISWSNEIIGLKWNHLFSDKVFASFHASYYDYAFNVKSENVFRDFTKTEIEENKTKSHYNSGIQDWTARYHIEYDPSPLHQFKMGAQFAHHYFRPGINASISEREVVNNTELGDLSKRANEFSVFLEDDMVITTKLKLNAGLHYNQYNVEQRSYDSFQPRLALKYTLTNKTSLKASFSQMQQNVHMLSNVGVGLPTDLWLPATAKAPSQLSDLWVLGMATKLSDQWQFSTEAYYKTMKNLIAYKEGVSVLNTNQQWESLIEVGKGRSYGLELLLQKQTGKLSGWLGYTLSWTSRQFDNISNGSWYPYKYDRRHDINLVGIYHLTPKLTLSGNFVFGTGNAVTLPLSSYRVDKFGVNSSGRADRIYYYDQRNNYRLRDYHRLDLSLKYSIHKGKWQHEIGASVYNVYNRRNAYYLKYALDTSTGKTMLRQQSLFGMIPSINYSLNF